MSRLEEEAVEAPFTPSASDSKAPLKPEADEAPILDASADPGKASEKQTPLEVAVQQKTPFEASEKQTPLEASEKQAPLEVAPMYDPVEAMLCCSCCPSEDENAASCDWGCQLHQRYSAAILLAHRAIRTKIMAQAPPGLPELPRSAESAAASDQRLRAVQF